jgi:ParB-like chromosome segregation protein Spo0J
VEHAPAELASRAIEAALAESTDGRASALVRLAADLRALGRADVALRALDAAWELRPSEKTRREAFTCAIAAHCDLGQHVVAEVVEREQAARSVDEAFARQALRLYSALSRLTGLDVHHSRRALYLSLLAGSSLAPVAD